MSEREASKDRLSDLGAQIDELLVEVPEVSDGTNLNTFDHTDTENGFEVGIAKSIRPDGQTAYHVRKGPICDSGYHESWDYHWGDCEPTVTHGRRHESRVFSSSQHPDDTYEVFPLNPSEAEDLVSLYRSAKAESGDS